MPLHHLLVQKAEALCSCSIAVGQKPAIQKDAKPHSANLPVRRRREYTEPSCSPSHEGAASNYTFSFNSGGTEVVPVRGWRLALACCAAQSAIGRGPCCAVQRHRLPWAAQLGPPQRIHQSSAQVGKMKTFILPVSAGVKQTTPCGLTGRSTGPYTACRHLR